MTARHVPAQQPAAPPANRAERRARGKRTAVPPAGRGKVQGSKFGGPAPRQYQARKHG
jgi:hypothetical protein